MESTTTTAKAKEVRCAGWETRQTRCDKLAVVMAWNGWDNPEGSPYCKRHALIRRVIREL